MSKSVKYKMDQFNLQEIIFESDTMDLDQVNEEVNWEVERKELESALNKAKKFHQKFVDDVIQTEEIRNQEFYIKKRDLIAVNKRQNAQIRELSKDKSFFESTCNALLKEKEVSCTSISQSTEPQESMPPSKRSTHRTTQIKSSCSASKFKISTKLFDDNEKLKEKLAKLSKSNTSLRLQVKKLENFKKKIENRREQQVRVSTNLQIMSTLLSFSLFSIITTGRRSASTGCLLQSTTRTNRQIFNASVLSRLDQFNRMQPNVEL